jgi:phage terminase large subunit
MAKLTLPYGYSPRIYQENVLNALDEGVRNICWVVHRRGGKDTTMWNYMIKRAYLEPGTYYYFLPSFAQAKRVIWDGMTNDGKRMLDYIPPAIIDGNPNNTEMKVWLKGAKGQSLIQLIGADSYDAIMGTNPRGVVFSEWSLMDPMAYDFIKPILAANRGWAAFIYTPRGKNHGWDLYEIARKNPDEWFCEILTIADTGVLTVEQIESERRKGMPDDMIQQEFYCNFNRGQEGSYYGRQMDGLRKKGRLTKVEYDPAVPVRTYWDLGVGDSTAIWFAQFVGKEIHLINYYENSGEGLPHYARVIDDYRRETECTYDLHMAPHDIQARELSTGKTRLETARRMGLNFRVAPRLSFESGVDAVRLVLARCWFDEKRCEQGIKCLENYRKSYNEKFRVYSEKAFHDWSSHGADAFRMLAITESDFQTDQGPSDNQYDMMRSKWGWKI